MLLTHQELWQHIFFQEKFHKKSSVFVDTRNIYVKCSHYWPIHFKIYTRDIIWKNFNKLNKFWSLSCLVVDVNDSLRITNMIIFFIKEMLFQHVLRKAQLYYICFNINDTLFAKTVIGGFENIYLFWNYRTQKKFYRFICKL